MSELGDAILELRKQGETYNSIVSELGCSKSTVAYWCNNTTKKKLDEKRVVNQQFHNLQKRISRFKHRENDGNKKQMCSDWNKKLRTCASNFRIRNDRELMNNYSYHDVIKHLGGMETRCYLTGGKINIEKDDFCLDHIIPASRNGSNELENMGITTPEANASKADMTVDEYLKLCKRVLENHGYSVEEPIENVD